MFYADAAVQKFYFRLLTNETNADQWKEGHMVRQTYVLYRILCFVPKVLADVRDSSRTLRRSTACSSVNILKTKRICVI